MDHLTLMNKTKSFLNADLYKINAVKSLMGLLYIFFNISVYEKKEPFRLY